MDCTILPVLMLPNSGATNPYLWLFIDSAAFPPEVQMARIRLNLVRGSPF